MNKIIREIMVLVLALLCAGCTYITYHILAESKTTNIFPNEEPKDNNEVKPIEPNNNI